MSTPTPRKGLFRRNAAAQVMADGTWLEPEEYCCSSVGFRRRAYAWCPDGKRRVIQCGLPDTMFSIPAKPVKIAGKPVRGYLTQAGDSFKFVAYTTVSTGEASNVG